MLSNSRKNVKIENFSVIPIFFVNWRQKISLYSSTLCINENNNGILGTKEATHIHTVDIFFNKNFLFVIAKLKLSCCVSNTIMVQVPDTIINN